MSIVILAVDSNQIFRTCASRCYNAKSKTCTCICNGRNHGVGKAAALNNLITQRLDILLDIRQRFPKVTIIDFPTKQCKSQNGQKRGSASTRPAT